MTMRPLNTEGLRSSGSYLAYAGPVSVAITTNQQSDGASKDGSTAFLCVSSGDETIESLISKRIFCMLVLSFSCTVSITKYVSHVLRVCPSSALFFDWNPR